MLEISIIVIFFCVWKKCVWKHSSRVVQYLLNEWMSTGKMKSGHPFIVITVASQVVLVVKNLPANSRDVKRHRFDPWVGKIPWRRAWQPTPVLA